MYGGEGEFHLFEETLNKSDAESLMKLRLSVLETDPYSFSVTEEEEK